MGCIKTLIILPMTSLYFSIVTRCKGPDEFMPYPMCFQVLLKESRLVPVRSKAVGKFGSIIRLDAFDGERERFYQVFHKLRRRIGAMFLKGFHEAPSGILINGCILEKLLPNNPAVFKAGGRNEFDVHLDTLTGIGHLLIGFWDVFWIWGMDSQDALFFEEAVKAWDGAGITALPEFDPENDQTGIGAAASHIRDQLLFLRGMLVRVMVWSPREVSQGFHRAVKTSLPAIDILSVGFIFDCSFGNTVLLGVTEQG